MSIVSIAILHLYLGIYIFPAPNCGQVKTLADLEQTLQSAGLMAGPPVPTSTGGKITLGPLNKISASTGRDTRGGKGKDGSTPRTGGKGKDGSTPRGGAKAKQGKKGAEKKGAERQSPVVTVLSSLQQPQPSSAMLCEISR